MRRPWVTWLLLALGVLAVAHNVRVYSSLLAKPNSTSRDALAERGDERGDAAQEPAATSDLIEIDAARLEHFLASLPVHERDPFRFASEAPTSAEQPSAVLRTPGVQGVLIGEGRRVAFIDGRARSEGEEVNGHVILRIEAKQVVFGFEGQEIRVVPTRSTEP